MWLAFGDRVRIIADRWHVGDRVNAIVDNARSKLVGADKVLAKGFRKALLARGPELGERNPPRHQELLDFLINVPALRRLYDAKESFLNIYSARSRQSAAREYEAWKSSLDEATAACFATIIKMVENWRSEIFAYWDRGYVEYRYDAGRYKALTANLGSGGPLAPLIRQLSKVPQWKGATSRPAEARNQIIRLVNRVGRSYSFRFIRARAIFSTYDVAANFGICVECRLPFKRDRRSRRHSSERRSHALLRGRRIQDGAAIAPTCRDCDPRSTGVTLAGAKPVDGSVARCGLRDIWTAPEACIADDPQALLEIESRYRVLKRRYRKRFIKGDLVELDRLMGDLFEQKVAS